MKCENCGRIYDLNSQEALCRKHCPDWSRCDLVPCPACFYEKVTDPAWYAGVSMRE